MIHILCILKLNSLRVECNESMTSHACIITQYGSTVDCHGWSSIIAIHKEILVFTFCFNLNLSSKDIKVENM